MEELLRPIYQRMSGREKTVGILIIEKTNMNSLLADQFDALVIVLENQEGIQDSSYNVEHYEIENKKIAVRTIEVDQYLKWLTDGVHRRYLLWILKGKLVYEKDNYVSTLRKTLHQFPIDIRKKKIGIEFAKLIRCYLNGKELYEGSQYIDAFNHMVKALHHLARLSVIEHGFYPEITVWKQVKQIEAEVYALYMELLESQESIDKRVQLLLLAIEFSLSTRAKIGSGYLVDVMKSKEEPWTISELMNEVKLKEVSLDVGLLLQYLMTKNIIGTQSYQVEGLNEVKYIVL